MGLPALDNLVRIGQLKPEPRNALEVKRVLDMARSRLAAQADDVPAIKAMLKRLVQGYQPS